MTTWSRLVRSIVGAVLLAGLVPLATAGCDALEGSSEKADKKKKKKKDGDDGAIKSDGKKIGDGPGGVPEADSYLADTGFRPAPHGFKFKNGDYDAKGNKRDYPESSPGHLDVDGMQRLFTSEKVCLGLERGECTLTPAADAFREKVNRSMNGGQCEGMAVFALSMFEGKDKASSFSASAQTVFDLNREQVRAPIGYYFAYQFLEPVRSHIFQRMAESTPNDVLDMLIASMNEKKDLMTLEFFAPPPMRGGHAVLPYAVEDKGNGVFWVRVWDNNWPGVSRYIEFDRNKNSWLYGLAATNPSEKAQAWHGDASRNTIIATQLSQRMRDAVCPFCRESDIGSRLIFVSDGGRALISDSSGRRVGWQGSEFVNEIPGAQAYPVIGFLPGEEPVDPVYMVPANEAYDIQVEGQRSANVDIGVFGAGSALIVDAIAMNKGQTDAFALASDGFGLTYKPGAASRKPKVRLAVDSDKNDYMLDLSDLKAEDGKALTFTVDPRKLSLNVKSGGVDTSDFDFSVTRYAVDGNKKTFKKSDMPSGRGLTGGGDLDFGSLE